MDRTRKRKSYNKNLLQRDKKCLENKKKKKKKERKVIDHGTFAEKKSFCG